MVSVALLLGLAAGTARAGGIDVVTDPPGASVWIDGKDTGEQTPATFPDLSPGTHDVEVRSGCLAGRDKIEVLGSGIAQARIDMVEQGGMLTLELTPSDARAVIDGGSMAIASGTPMAVDCGEHQLRVEAPGYDQALVRVDIKARDSVVLPVTLDQLGIGWFDVDLAPAEASLWIDDGRVGTGPQRVEVNAGPHVLRATLDGYQEQERQLLAQADTTTPVAFSLKPVSTGRKHKRWVGLVVGGLGAGGLGYAAFEYTQARPGWNAFLDRKDLLEQGITPNGWSGAPEDWAYQVYDEEVKPHRTRMIIADVVGGVLLSTGVVLTIAL